MLNNLYTSLIVSFGLFCGVFLAFIAPEELKEGKRYFVFLRSVLLLATIILIGLLFYLKTSQLLILTMALIFIYGFPVGTLLAHKYIKRKWHYILLKGLIFYFIFVLVSSTLLFFF